ncbi:hypothetical protein [Robiginitalea sp. SC105]|uniref:hypothetical protein n=1 Tax=Robiginitalea sp. SC105 TaxID=2762332 RepID=UPI00163A4FEB|nr:hypothetical protein [Robiginitalea sp. SC105]MBC2837939.1 hypothetical protein [Robiginitalea sp. SC105]
MAKQEQKVIKEAPLSNNCPECFNQDLTLRFYQKHLYGALYHRISGEVTRELECNTCKSLIYPVKWTEDIDRSVEYYEKAVTPERPRVRFKAAFYVLVLLGICLVGAVVYAYLQGLF